MIRKLFFFLSLFCWFILFSCQREIQCENCAEKNKPPVANAGRDTLIILPLDSVMLNGGTSYDPDGNITEYLWTEISNAASLSIVHKQTEKPIVKNFTTGVYQVELKVIDNKGAIDKDTVMIIVADPATSNHPPIANAGLDKIISLPTSTISLDGSGSSDPDNNISGFNWSKISGPASFNSSNSNSVQTQVTSLVEGIYQFKLTVTDSGGLLAADTVKITVSPQRPQSEIILDSLTWNYWHDSNDPLGIFDEIYLSIPDTANILSYTPISIFVKLNSTSTWIPVNPITNGVCTDPYYYIIVPNVLGDLILFVEHCTLNSSLIGTGASVKIVY